MQNPVFARIVSTQEYRVQGPPMWIFRNGNQLLSRYPGADGVKTGYTDNAGRCLVFSATRDGRRAISVVLDSDTQWDDSIALMDYFFKNYTWKTLSVANSPLNGYSQDGMLLRATPKSQPQVVFPSWQEPYLRWFFSLAEAPTRVQGLIGSAAYYLFGKRAGEIELFDGGG